MTLSRKSVETLIDLVQIKLSCVEVHDQDDKRELAKLEHCLGELQSLIQGGDGDMQLKRRGRPRGAPA